MTQTIKVNLITEAANPNYLTAVFDDTNPITLNGEEELNIALGSGWPGDAVLVYIELFAAKNDGTVDRADMSDRRGGWSMNDPDTKGGDPSPSGRRWRDVWQHGSEPVIVGLGTDLKSMSLTNIYKGNDGKGERDMFFEVGIYSKSGFEVQSGGVKAATIYLWTPDPEVKLIKGTGTP